jgi:Sec7-like guanine-nucleotide exchange factor
MEFFLKNGCVAGGDTAIASFLYDTVGLDARQVGELLGSTRNSGVLSAFVERFDFTGVSFSEAFRHFLLKLHVPAEAQQVDRIMAAFSTKFFLCNPTLFSSVDTCYAIAFSLLTLHVDAFSGSVKKNMTLEQFVANNRRIDNGNDLPVSFLTDLYQNITSKPVFGEAEIVSREQPAALYKKRVAKVVSKAKRSAGRTKRFMHCRSPLLIRPMLEVIWRDCLAVLTTGFEKGAETDRYRPCLDGLELLVHLGAHCFVENALDMLLDAFGSFTGLRHARETATRQKNIEVTNRLIEIAQAD